jgi:uncharacterized protein
MIDHIGCVGNSIKTASGGYIDLSNPHTKDITLEAIGRALSKMCRYGGHCPDFYSVAEHCVTAVELAQEDGLDDKHVLRAILLHDAAEAYIGDVVKPLKIMLPDYGKVEERMEKAVARRFDVSFSTYAKIVKYYDLVMLRLEHDIFWPDDETEWHGFSEIPARDKRLRMWGHNKAYGKYMDMAEKLGVK